MITIGEEVEVLVPLDPKVRVAGVSEATLKVGAFVLPQLREGLEVGDELRSPGALLPGPSALRPGRPGRVRVTEIGVFVTTIINR